MMSNASTDSDNDVILVEDEPINEQPSRTMDIFRNVNRHRTYFANESSIHQRQRTENWERTTRRKEQESEQAIRLEEEESGDIKKIRVPISKRIINTAEGTQTERVLLPESIAVVLKPHQLEGVRFCWKHIVTAKFRELKGCILAHSMGLGKTLQMFSLIYMYILHANNGGGRRVLICCPKSVILNWCNEFKMWTERCDLDYDIPMYVIEDSVKTSVHREKLITKWSDEGGVLIMTYGMYTRLVGEKALKSSKRQSVQQDYLDRTQTYEPVNNHNRPKRSRVSLSNTSNRIKGASPPSAEKKQAETEFNKRMRAVLEESTELVIVDEGSSLKNHKTCFSRALRRVKTRNRIVLTGTPLQNHLAEYFNMIDFVRRGYWTRKDFQEMFAIPIQDGFKRDSDTASVQQMKRQSYVLVQELKNFVDRRDQQILVDTLPKKCEYVISFRLSKVQHKLYQLFLKSKSTASYKHSIIYLAAMLQKIVNHPDMLLSYCRRVGIESLEDQQRLERSIRQNTETRHHELDEDDEDDEDYQPKKQAREDYQPKKQAREDYQPKKQARILKVETIEIDSEVEEVPVVSPNNIKKEQETIVIDDDDLFDDKYIETKSHNFASASPKLIKEELVNRTVHSNRSSIKTEPQQSIQEEEIDEIDRILAQPNRPIRKKRSIRSRKRDFVHGEEEDEELRELEQVLNGEDEIDDEDDFSWAKPVLQPNYKPNRVWHSPKMEFLMRLITKCYEKEEKMLIFTQYTEMLDVMEQVFHNNPIPMPTGEKRKLEPIVDYLILEGRNSTKDRQRMIDDFNSEETSVRLFLISTTAGGQGINLTAATRIVLFDVTWDPAWGSQAIFRAYRFGQKKEVHVYRFITSGTVEENIWLRCVAKMWLFHRIVDDRTPERKISHADLNLFKSDGVDLREDETQPMLNPEVYEKDDMLLSLLGTQSNLRSTQEHILYPVNVLERDLPSVSQRVSQNTVTIDLEEENASYSFDESMSSSVFEASASNSSPETSGAGREEEGEFDVKQKIASVFHFESLYLEDPRDRLTAEEREASMIAYQSTMAQKKIRNRELNSDSEGGSEDEDVLPIVRLGQNAVQSAIPGPYFGTLPPALDNALLNQLSPQVRQNLMQHLLNNSR